MLFINNVNQYSLIALSTFLALIITLFLIALNPLLSKIKSKDTSNKGIKDKKIKEIDPNLTNQSLKDEVFSLYKKLETAKTKQNINILKEIGTNNFFKEQERIIKSLKEKQQKMVATNIKLESFKVLSIKEKDNSADILIYLHVSQYDYVIDKNKNVVRGTEQAEYQIEYKILLEHISNELKIKKKECIGKWIKN